MYYTAKQIIRNEKKNENGEWTTFPKDEREKAFDAIKSFVASTARGNRRQRIMSTEMYLVHDCGILSRLWYYPETQDVYYCCGQEWNSEMAVLRDVFDYRR